MSQPKALCHFLLDTKFLRSKIKNMTPLDVLKDLEGLVNQQENKRYARLRHILLLASGSLSVLISLRAGFHDFGFPRYCISTALASLGLGILFGAVAIHGEVATAQDLVNQKKAQGRQLLDNPEANVAPILSALPRRYAWAERLCYFSLIVSVISLVLYAIISN
jgi:hypothetical protein